MKAFAIADLQFAINASRRARFSALGNRPTFGPRALKRHPADENFEI
jgi:hypothetical protein